MTLNYEISGQEQGSAQSVIVIHGLFGSLDNLKVIARHLGEQFHVVNVDVRNHGHSQHSEHMDYPQMADDVLALMNELNIDVAHIVGHSMGGKIAMQFALINPTRLKKLVVLDIAPVAYHSRHDAIFQALEAVAEQKPSSRSQADQIMSQYVETPGVRQFLSKSLHKTDSGSLDWLFNLPTIKAQYKNILGELSANDSCLCDTLFIKGADSDYIQSEYTEATRKLFSNASVKIIQGAGHWLHAEKPVAVNKSISDFLNRP